MAVTDWRKPSVMLGCGAVILAVSFGVRHTFGLFLQPISFSNGWGREVFALAIAVQNLVWGLAQPFIGMLADRIGAGKVIFGGAVLYVLGVVFMAIPQNALLFVISTGVLIGLGLGGTTSTIVFGAIGRAYSPEQRSVAFGIAMAVGSFGQFLFLPATPPLMDWLGWPSTLIALSILCATIIPLSFGLFETPAALQSSPGLPWRQAIGQAFGHPGFWLLSSGFFVCGFQVVLIGTHLPAFLIDKGLSIGVATVVLALIGLFNIAGTYWAGRWGARYSKPKLLTAIYLGRAIAIGAFAFLPVSTWSAYAFGIVIGLLWLSTVPLTNGTVAVFFGVKNMSMLAGFVFLAHQLGAFLGGWIGGFVFDRFGSYDTAWALAIGLSLLAAALNVPIREESVPVTSLQGQRI
jgi:MFS family permease